MSRQSIKQPTFGQRVINRLGPGLSMFLATLLALPVNAGITLPTDPLTTASRVPPNILFILDDSGSMAWKYMYNPDITSVTGGGITSNRTGNGTNSDSSVSTTDTGINGLYDQNYVTNTLYYNPSLTYAPWLDSTGVPLSGGTSYTAASSDGLYVTNAAAGTTSGTVNLSNSTQTFYVPKPGITNYADATQYYRYQIRASGEIVRSERLQASFTTDNSSGTLATNLSANSGNYTNTYNVNVPAGASNLVFTTSGGGTCSGQCANLYVRFNAQPTTANYTCRSQNNGNAETCSIAAPSTGNYQARLYAGSNFSGVTLSYSYSVSTLNTGAADVGCDTTSSGWGWRQCTVITPTGRSAAAEKTNFATWYSYHRTRTKAAKAGASTAFSDLGIDVRVGFRTIWGRNGSTTNQNWPTQSVPIPVSYNDGLFDNPNGVGGTNNNRARWFNRLFATTASSGTPLKGALQQAGLYFSSAAGSGPYGPQTGTDQLACRQNFAILTTDGYWNDNSGYDSPVANSDNTQGSVITSPTGASYQYSPSRPYQDGNSNTLADVALHYWKNDLRPGTGGLSNIVPTSSANPAFWQHMVTFGISIGLKGTLNPETDLAAITAGTKSWPNPTSDNITTIDDLWHASVNGRGQFLAASNPTEFADGLKAALATVTERTGSFSNVSANSATLDAGAFLFQANYVSSVWTGELLGYPRATTGGGFSSTASWRASTGIPTTGRKVFTSAGAFPANATTAQLTALTRTGASNFPVTGAQNAAYIAGTRTLELQNGGTLRNRNHLLGDIVSSSPTYVRETNTLYVGANDGMLHAVNAANGNELFAFIPNGINWSNLGSLSRPDYGHRYFVDGPTVVSTRTQTPGASILVGALGKGGKGLFALDVTNPAGFTASNVKWQITADDDILTTADNNIGLIQGKPIIARLNNGVMAVIVSNGINSSNGRAVLLVYNLDTGALIREIDTGIGSSVTDHANSNGLSAPVGWNPDGNNTLDYVYAGDMLGNVWKFDLSGATSGSWGVANAGSPLFTAVGPDGTTRQPITAGLTLGRHPTTYKTWVFFGTGRFITPGDVTNNAVQSLYGVMDEGTTVAKSALTSRKVLVTGTSSNGLPVRSFEVNGSLPTASKGWYINLVDPPTPPGTAAGERVVTSPQMDGSVLEVSTIIPTADACQSDGRGYLNALDAFTGTSASKPYFDVNGDGNFSNDTLPVPNTSNETTPIGSVDIGVGMVSQGALFSNPPSGPGLICASGSSGGSGCIGKNEVRNVGRVSWREVIRN